MLHANHCFAFTVFFILFLQSCNTLDLSNADTADIIYISNANGTSKNEQNIPINVSTQYVTKFPVYRSTGKKWKVGRVSRQQYEIINMLWRKTNIFADEEITLPESPYTEPDISKNDVVKHLTPNAQKADHITSTPRIYSYDKIVEEASLRHPSTESYIEFYYLDESVDPMTIKPEIKPSEIFKINTKMRDKAAGRLGQFKNFVSRSPLFSFRLNEPVYKRMNSKLTNLMFITSLDTTQSEQISKIKVNSNNDFLQRFLTRNTAPQYVRPVRASAFTTETAPATSETPNDRVKFFEMYDSNTHASMDVNSTNSYKDNEVMREEEKIELEHVDKNIGHGPNKIRYVKKHVKNGDIVQNVTQFVKSLMKINKPIIIRTTTPAKQTVQEITKTPNVTAPWDDVYQYTSRVLTSAAWSTYPFAAVYVYERFQVHCDAAAISPYWLVASAACISRHREDPDGDRSAFIAYCGENWWNPERIAYVKYTLVHPRYHPKDTTRRHLYNIGVIQVASSMSSSCQGWAPVSIMSHQYVTEPTGSVGSAVGWGLNRYDTSYASRDLPRHPLSVYESYIFSSSCPGNTGYRNIKRVSEEATSNIYCLALPAYIGEDTDPVHGGLLLVGGKLIALYLQEERRRWGDQSAQYTGVWRLIPWVLDVAKDPEEMDFALVR